MDLPVARGRSFMIRTLLWFFIERSLDHGRQPPRYLRWLARHDPQLRMRSQRAMDLDRALRSAALSRRHDLASGRERVAWVEPRPRDTALQGTTRSAARWGWLAATAAALTGIAAFANHYHQQQTNAARARYVSAKLAEVPDGLLTVITEVTRSSQEFSPMTQISLPKVNLWSDIPRSTQGQLKQSFSMWGSHLSDMGERVYEQFDFRGEGELN